MPPDTVPENVHGRWLHSHEEDNASEMVFRPASYNFPPSRGRTGFDLRPDQSLAEIGIAPSDGPQETAGRWELEPGNKLAFYDKQGSRKAARTLQIVSASKDRLIVAKQPPR